MPERGIPAEMNIRGASSMLVVAVLIAANACGSSGGDSCTSDGDCGSGVKCLRDKVSSGGTCVDLPGSGTCSLACTTSAQCKTYGSSFKCALAQTDVACNPTGICRDNYAIDCSKNPNCRIAPEN